MKTKARGQNKVKAQKIQSKNRKNLGGKDMAEHFRNSEQKTGQEKTATNSKKTNQTGDQEYPKTCRKTNRVIQAC